MISKETFIKTLDGIIKQKQLMADFSDAINNMSDGHIVFDKDNLILRALIDVLEDAYDDNEHIIQNSLNKTDYEQLYNKVATIEHIISKQTFVNALENIKKQQKRNNEFCDALEKVADGYIAFNTEDYNLNNLIEILDEIMGVITDEIYGDTISWWLWENVDKTIYDVKGYPIADATTPEGLYDYLVSQME